MQMPHVLEKQQYGRIAFFLLLCHFIWKHTACLSCADAFFPNQGTECLKCPDNCLFCESNEYCLSCTNGYWGTTCEFLCSNCMRETSCEKTNGFCQVGCRDGYSGVLCDTKCNNKCSSCERTAANNCSQCAFGRYPPVYCEKLCPDLCFEGKCNATGFCTSGCERGFWGDTCGQKCPMNCKDRVCFEGNGTCTFGCTDKGSGPYCKEHRRSLVAVVVPIGVAVPLVVLVVVTLVIWRMRLRRKSRLAEQGTPEQIKLMNVKPDKTTKTGGAEATEKTAGKILDDVRSAENTLLKSPQTTNQRQKQNELYQHVKVIKTKTDEEYQSEWVNISKSFNTLCEECVKGNPPGTLEENGISPYEYNKVSVKGEKKSYYFNASYIGKERRKKYHFVKNRATHVACIGPTTEYRKCFELFWTMVWQAESLVIVMLNTLKKKEDEQYWPDVSQRLCYPQIWVKCETEEKNNDYDVRSIELRKASETRHVKQFQYKAWAEKKGAENVENFLKFWKVVQVATSRKSGSVVVHGRSGVGRTGTFIALDVLWKEAEFMLACKGSLKTTHIDIRACVENLRKQRVCMIETIEQYKFLHEAFGQVLLNLLEERGFQPDDQTSESEH